MLAPKLGGNRGVQCLHMAAEEADGLSQVPVDHFYLCGHGEVKSLCSSFLTRMEEIKLTNSEADVKIKY